MNTAIMTTINRTVSKVGFKMKKHSPEILVAAGIVGVISSTVMACRATLKVNEIVDETKENLDKIHTATDSGVTEAGENYSIDDAKKDTTIVYVQTGLKIAKTYAPAVILGTLSITSILASNNILRKRNAALGAAYAALDKGFKQYRQNVINRWDEQVDRELKYNLKAQKVEETVTDEETGKTKKVKKTIDVVSDENLLPSPYARFFDEKSDYYEKNAEMNLMFLRAEQNFANDRLRTRGYVTLNEIYERLDIPRTKAGQIVGWVYDPNGDGDSYIDFGIYETNREKNRDFVNGYERAILLDFNVQGDILDLISTHQR